MKVTEGETVQVNLLKGEPGDAVSFGEVLAYNSGSSLSFGAPLIANAKVSATIKGHVRGEKVLVFKYPRKNKHKKIQGHRQPYTLITVNEIKV